MIRKCIFPSTLPSAFYRSTFISAPRLVLSFYIYSITQPKTILSLLPFLATPHLHTVSMVSFASQCSSPFPPVHIFLSLPIASLSSLNPCIPLSPVAVWALLSSRQDQLTNRYITVIDFVRSQSV